MSQKPLRCAIYTRKSSEEGLDQDFNSLEAQREACEAYVRSQSHEGWQVIPNQFNDGGFSGGNVDRPALLQLMSMVRDGQVDIIVIYKIDRLTRSLTDFARLAETFDKHNVSFVSVTQQFNTTNSMGRLMLNVLLSFAQFEREITGERIRDKVAASKKKGIWMGGNVPMGYDIIDRHLTINQADAKTVRQIFDLYLEETTVPNLVVRLQREDICTAVRTTKKGNKMGGRTFSRGHLYQMLSSQIYVGRIPHKKTSYLGLHKPIISQKAWDAVQALLAKNTQGARTRRLAKAKHPSLLAGVLFAENGNRFQPMHANKGSQRYRYYVEEQGIATTSPATRLPAREIEHAVLSGLRNVLTNPSELLQVLGHVRPEQMKRVFSASAKLAEQLRGRIGVEEITSTRKLVHRVVCGHNQLQINLSTLDLSDMLGLKVVKSSDSDRNNDNVAVIEVPLAIKRRGVQAKLVIGGQNVTRQQDASLITAIVRAHDWVERLTTGVAVSIADIAMAEGVTSSYVSKVVPLAFIAPDIIERILAGDQPPEMTAHGLLHVDDLPLQWEEQRKVYS